MGYILNISFIIIGTLIGAGFITGAEIRLFFYHFGINGYIGLGLSAIIFGIIIFNILQRKEKTYHELLNNILKNNTLIQKIINGIILVFILFSFIIMCAGFSSFLESSIGLNKTIVSIFLCTISFITLKSGSNGLAKLNTILIPFLLLIILMSTVFLSNEKTKTKQEISGYITTSISYTSYNSILLIPILLEIKNSNKSKKENIIISVITSAIIFICGFIILSLLRQNPEVINQEIPILNILENNLFSVLIKIGIMIAMTTTAISSEYAFVKEISKTNKQYIRNLGIISTISILISKVGFQSLIENLYPTFGVLGFINLLIIFLSKY